MSSTGPRSCGIASIGLDHQQHPRRHAGRDRRAKRPASPSAACRWSALAQPAEARGGDHRDRRSGRRAAAARRPRLDDRSRRSSPRSPARTRSATPTSPGRCSRAQDALTVPRDAFLAGLAAARLAGALPAPRRRPADQRRRDLGRRRAQSAMPPRALAAHLRRRRGPMHIVLGILANKDADGDRRRCSRRTRCR